jgi:hypothetical protein
VVALMELIVIAAVGALAAWALETTVLTASGALALLYYPLMNAIAGRVRRPWNVAHAEGAARRLTVSVTPSPAFRLAIRARVGAAIQAVTRGVRAGVGSTAAALASLRTHVARRAIPVLAQLSRATSRGLRVAATTSSQFAWRTARGANRSVAWAVRRTTLVFWRAVGTVSEHAYVVASRQMNRTKQ